MFSVPEPFAAPPVPELQQKTSDGVTAESVLTNPGSFEEIGRKLKGSMTFSFMLYVDGDHV